MPPKISETKNSGKSSVGNSGKSDGKFGQKQWGILGKSNGKIRAKGIIFAQNICRRFPSFLIAFAQIFPLLLPELPLFLPEFPIAFLRNSGKSNTEICAKAMRKLGWWNFRKKQWEIRAKGIIFARNICRRFPSFLIAFAQIFPLLLPELPLFLSEFSHCFSPKFWQKQLEILAKAIQKFVQNLCNEKTRKLSGGIYFGQKLRKFWAISRIDIIIFQIYLLDQIKILIMHNLITHPKTCI